MTKAAATKAPAKKPSLHPTYKVMITTAIKELKDRKGASRQAIQAYIEKNFKGITQAPVHMKKTLTSGIENGTFERVKGVGMSGRFKIKKVEAVKKDVKKPAVKKRAAVSKKKASPVKKSPKKVVKKTVKKAAKKPVKKAASKKK